jgi:hypothetical protein
LAHRYLSDEQPMTAAAWDKDAEEALLGAMLANESACTLAAGQLEPCDFFSPTNGELFDCLRSMLAAGEQVDVVSAGARLAALKDRIYALAGGCISATNISTYIKLVKEAAAKRRLRAGALKALQLVAESNGDLGSLLADYEAAIDEARHSVGQRLVDATDRKGRFHLAAEVADEAPSRPAALVGELIFGGLSHVLMAPPKFGKTTLLFAIVRAVTEGLPWAGRAVKQGAVLYVTEEGPAGTAYKIGKHGLTELPVYFSFPADRRGLDFSAIVDLLLATANDVGAGGVIFDTVAAVAGIRGDDENSAGQMLGIMAELDRLKEAGLAVICAVHERKSGGSIEQAVRGSSALTGGVDMLIRLEKPSGEGHEKRRCLQVEGRIDVQRTVVIELGDDGSFTYVGDEKAATKADARRLILDLLPASSEEALPEQAIIDALKEANVGRTTVQEVLRGLCPDDCSGPVRRDKGAGDASNRAYGYWYEDKP